MIPVKCPVCGETLTMFHNTSITREDYNCPACGASLVYYNPNDEIDWDALRQQYAGMAMQGMIASQPLYGINPELLTRIAKRAVEAADALITELKGDDSSE